MKTKKVNINELKPYLNNAKLHPGNQIEQINELDNNNDVDEEIEKENSNECVCPKCGCRFEK